MKKSILLAVIVLLLTSSSLFAKTIWIRDGTNDHPSMVTFYNALIEDLKLTQYKKYITTVTNYDQMKQQKGDIVISLAGNGASSNTGNISYFYWIGFKVDNCDSLAYIEDGGTMFSDDYIFEQARKYRIKIVKFLDENF